MMNEVSTEQYAVTNMRAARAQAPEIRRIFKVLLKFPAA